jgi:hypothetical protein
MWLDVDKHCVTGGDIRLEKLREASLRIKSDGGSVHLGNIKADQAEVQTDGGNLEVTAT